MILIGQYDSPFVRRVGIALTLYELAFEHRPWSAWGDADQLRALNPLTRVPTLVLDDGDVLIDSHGILDYLDGLAPAERLLIPVRQPERRRAQWVIALACGAAEKSVSLYYELRLHEAVSAIWIDRCRRQIAATLAVLEAERGAASTPCWFDDRLGHADIAVGAMMRFIAEALPDHILLADYPGLLAFSRRLEALPVFQAISQPFIAPR
jgi:glutathione S-transferase